MGQQDPREDDQEATTAPPETPPPDAASRRDAAATSTTSAVPSYACTHCNEVHLPDAAAGFGAAFNARVAQQAAARVALDLRRGRVARPQPRSPGGAG